MMKGREKQPRCFSKENMGKINVENMDLYYGQFHALKNINLDIPEKKITAFIGPSGCGKSTLLKSFRLRQIHTSKILKPYERSG